LTDCCQAILRHKKTGHSISKCPVFNVYYWFYITLPLELRARELHQEPRELHQEHQERQEHQEHQELREREQGPQS
jgi:hypothetical protein